MPSRLKLLAGTLAFAAIAVAVGVAVWLFVIDNGGGAKAAPRPADGHYQNSKMRYSFDYPTDWQDVTDLITFSVPKEAQVLDRVAVGVVDKDTGVFRGAQVTVVKLNRKVKESDLDQELSNLDDLFKQQAAAVKGKLDPPKPAELGGLKARQYLLQFAFTSTQVVFDVASSQVVTFFGDKQYTVNCQGASADYNKTVVPGCEQLLQSFRFH
jgi:hypothetical protein